MDIGTIAEIILLANGIIGTGYLVSSALELKRHCEREEAAIKQERQQMAHDIAALRHLGADVAATLGVAGEDVEYFATTRR